jgi:hypothetical protein
MSFERRSGLAAAIMLFGGTAASAQDADEPPPPPAKDETGERAIVVTAPRGSAITDVPPIAEFDADAVAAMGATSMAEVLRTIRGTTQGADGSEPIYLINAQRISSNQEIGSLAARSAREDRGAARAGGAQVRLSADAAGGELHHQAALPADRNARERGDPDARGKLDGQRAMAGSRSCATTRGSRSGSITGTPIRCCSPRAISPPIPTFRSTPSATSPGSAGAKSIRRFSAGRRRVGDDRAGARDAGRPRQPCRVRRRGKPAAGVRHRPVPDDAGGQQRVQGRSRPRRPDRRDDRRLGQRLR